MVHGCMGGWVRTFLSLCVKASERERERERESERAREREREPREQEDIQ